MAELETKVDRCLRRCDSDLEQFGNEIELEQPGITEQLAENALNLEPQKAEAKKDYETDEDDYTVNTVPEYDPLGADTVQRRSYSGRGSSLAPV